MEMPAPNRIKTVAVLLWAVLSGSGCATQAFFDAREQEWLAQQEAYVSLAELPDPRHIPAGSRDWIGYGAGELTAVLGQPDQRLAIVSGGTAYVYVRGEQRDVSCYESYRVDDRGRIFSVECI